MVFEGELEDRVKEGATMELISYAPEGEEDVVGWYLLLNHPERGCLLWVKYDQGKPKVILTDRGCFAIAKKLGVPSVLVPVIPMIRDQNAIWDIYHERNFKFRRESITQK